MSVPSLWRLGFEQIHIDRPTLDVRRLADGRLLVAGLDVLSAPARPGETNPAADWLFAQAELVIRSGQVRWRDDQQPGAPPLTLQDVDVVVRNPGELAQALQQADAHRPTVIEIHEHDFTV